MKLIVETFITVIFISLTVIIVSQVIYSQIIINRASSFHTNAIQVIEESDFDIDVISQCIEEAVENGYQLEVSYDKECVMKCSACNSSWQIGEETVCPNCNSTNIYAKQVSSEGLVTLNYDVKIGVLGIEKEGVLQSNAR